ncbi:MAG: STAS domain-containing protein [Actinomycetota bacterium]|nr:STAS domain-containing protein [Actinomycetota bacterium]
MLDVNIKEPRNGTAIVSLAGEFDISEVPDVEKKLKAVEKRRPDLLVLDLRELTFMDSSGLRVVLEADLRSRRDARRFALIPGPEPVHRVFLIALLDKRLEFVEDPSLLEGAGEDEA